MVADVKSLRYRFTIGLVAGVSIDEVDGAGAGDIRDTWSDAGFIAVKESTHRGRMPQRPGDRWNRSIRKSLARKLRMAGHGHIATVTIRSFWHDDPNS